MAKNDEVKEQKDLKKELTAAEKQVEKQSAEMQKLQDQVDQLSEKNNDLQEQLKASKQAADQAVKQVSDLEKKAGKVSSEFPVLPQVNQSPVTAVTLITEVQLSKDEQQKAFRIEAKNSGILMLQIRLKGGQCVDAQFAPLKV